MEQYNARGSDTPEASKKSAPIPEPIKTESREPPYVEHPVIVNVETEDSAVHQNGATGKQKPTDEISLVNAIKKGEKWMIGLTLIIALATAANVFVFYFESESTAKQVSRLAAKAEEIVGSVDTALLDNRKAIASAFAENEAALKLSEQRSRAAFGISVETLRAYRRPLFVLDAPPNAVAGIGGFSAGAKEYISVNFRNAGTAPAEDPEVEAWLVFPGEKRIAPAFHGHNSTKQTNVIPPGELYRWVFSDSKQYIARLQAGPVAFIEGRIAYSEVSDIVAGGQTVETPATFCTVFCFIALPGPKFVRGDARDNLCVKKPRVIDFAPLGFHPPTFPE